MALTITAVPDIKYVLGESGRVQFYDLQPGSSDYPTSGYPITAAQAELGQLVGVDILGTNAAGQLYAAAVVLPTGTIGVNPSSTPTASLVVTLAGIQVTSGTDLSAVAWRAAFWGW